jgi:hypothetical protein
MIKDIVIFVSAILLVLLIWMLVCAGLNRAELRDRLYVLEDRMTAHEQLIGAIEQERIAKRAEALRKIRAAKEMKEK